MQGDGAKRAPDVFERITPEEAGYSRERLKLLEEFLPTSGSQSLLLAHDGKIFLEWGDFRRRLLVHSVRKALLSSLFGVYHGRGAIDLDKTLGELDVDDTPPSLSAQEKTAFSTPGSECTCSASIRNIAWSWFIEWTPREPRDSTTATSIG